MAVDPRFNFVVKCPNTANQKQSDAQKRKSFFNGLGKIGDIELLNDLGAGEVAQGLRTLAKTSDSIRTGETSSAIITNGVSGDQDGANVVLSAVGIDPQQAQKAGQFNPGVLNRGTAQAKQIFNQVKDGNYSLNDIPNGVTDLQNLSSLTKGIFTAGATDQNRIELCGARPYARALIRFAPKYKFLFVLQFTLKEEYASWANVVNNMAFVVKSSGRPNINIEHEEVNMYNFWTRVPKRTVYEPITMRFFDDSKNNAHIFYNAYLEAISPLARLGGIENPNALMDYRFLENSGLNGSRRNVQSSASLGALEGNNTAIIDELRMFHLFDYGRFMTVYNYKNPKILQMNLDDFDMADNGNGNEVEFQFGYDALHITPVLSVEAEQTRVKNITGESIGITDLNINPVFTAGPSSSAEGGGFETSGLPQTKEQDLISSLSGAIEGGLGAVGGAIEGAINTGTGAVSDAFSAGSDFVGSLFKGDSPGGGTVD